MRITRQALWSYLKDKYTKSSSMHSLLYIIFISDYRLFFYIDDMLFMETSFIQNNRTIIIKDFYYIATLFHFSQPLILPITWRTFARNSLYRVSG